MIKAFSSKRQFLLLWAIGLAQKLDSQLYASTSFSSLFLHSLPDENQMGWSDSPPSSKNALTRKYNIDVALITSNKHFFVDLLKALKLFPQPSHDVPYYDQYMEVIDALKYHAHGFGLVDDTGLFQQLYKDYGQKNTGWNILKILFLILFLKQHPPHQLNDLSIFGLNTVAQSEVVSYLPESKGPDCLRQQPIEIYEAAIAVLHDALSLFRIDKELLLSSTKFMSTEMVARLSDSDGNEEEDLSIQQSPIRRRDSYMSRKASRGNMRVESASLDTRATHSKNNWKSLVLFEENKDFNKRKDLRPELEKEKNANKQLIFELEEMTQEVKRMEKEMKMVEQVARVQKEEKEQIKAELLSECKQRDQQLQIAEIKKEQLLSQLKTLDKKVEELERSASPPQPDLSEFVHRSLFQNLQFELNGVKQQSEEYERKWVDALMKIKSMAPSSMPPLPFSTNQPLFTPQESALYLEPNMEDERLSYTKSVLASQDIQNRIACAQLIEKVEHLEQIIKEKNEDIEQASTNYRNKKEQYERAMQLSKNYEKLYKIYFTRTHTQRLLDKQKSGCGSFLILALFLLVAVLIVLHFLI